MIDTPDTSVVLISWVPNAYRMKILRQSFASLKAHTQYPHVLVVVDNGPSEQTEFLKTQDIDVHVINGVNQGVGKSRNQGAKATQSEYIAFVDNDIGYFPGWLGKCIEALKTFDDRKLIATARKTHPMKQRKYHAGALGAYSLWMRCAGMCLVMKRDAWLEMGTWSEASNPGHRFCHTARAKGYRFLWHEQWTARHLAKRASYHYKKQVFQPQTGLWVPNGEQKQ